MTKIVAVVLDSEDKDISEINLIEEMIDGNVSYFADIKSMLDDGDDYSENKIFILETIDYGTVKNNPKFISEKPQVKVSKKK